MKSSKFPRRILWYENAGFLAIIALSWANELLDLPRLVFGGETRINWHESVLETFLVLLVWIPVHLVTRRLLARLYYLEGFLRVCAWCRKVAHEDQWLPLEQYFAQGLSIQTSHGICPECASKVLSEHQST